MLTVPKKQLYTVLPFTKKLFKTGHVKLLHHVYRFVKLEPF